MMRLVPYLLAAALAACSQFPELDAAVSPGVAEADYPTLLPLGGLLTGPEPRATQEMRGGIEARVAGLRARAARLGGAVVADPVKTRMRRGVHWPYDAL